jgi:hypothetical protein
MKLIILPFLLFCAANSFKIEISEVFGRVPRNICAVSNFLNFKNLKIIIFQNFQFYPSGTTFPVAYDCNQFVVCVAGHITIAKCPPSAMYFDPCTSMCSPSSHVCSNKYCDSPEEPVPTETPIEEPTEAPEEWRRRFVRDRRV